MDKALQYINHVLLELVRRADISEFEKQINNNLLLKKNKSSSEVNFFTQLMLNIIYFQKMNQGWKDVFLKAFSQGDLPKISSIEQELLSKQIQVRQEIIEESGNYTNSIQEQYQASAYSEKMLRFEYAKLSIEHSLRIDFITVLIMNKHSEKLLQNDLEELLLYIEQKIHEYSREIVEKIKLN